MKSGWEELSFLACLQKAKKTPKIPRKQFLSEGIYPIVSQENDLINGYWNDSQDVYYVDTPVVIFGDHTKRIKLIDFDFVVGADGVKILLPIDRLISKFFAYQLESIKLRDLGYARHYRLLKEVKIAIPPLSEQEKIVAILDEAFAAIDQAKANIEQNIANAKELFQSKLNQIFSQKGDGWVETTLDKITTHISDGDHSPPPKSETGIPFITISNIDKDRLEIDFSSTFMVPEDYYASLKDRRKPFKDDVLYTVTGSFGFPVHISAPSKFCFQRHIGLLRPNAQTNGRFLFYLMQSPEVYNQANSGATGTAQRTVSLSLLRKMKIPSVPLEQQPRIVEQLDSFSASTRQIESHYRRKLASLDELKKSILQKAFAGELT